jgi:phage anti-repressor protein
MEKVLWLDDLRDPSQGQFKIWLNLAFGENLDVTWVKDYDEFVKYFKKNEMPYAISFDHDLGNEITDQPELNEKTGLDCAKWIVDYCMNNAVRLPKYFVHSANPVGRENIQSYLDNYLKFTDFTEPS